MAAKELSKHISFRYSGKFQSIHHIEEYVLAMNLHSEIAEMLDKEWELHFIYILGPAIVPAKDIKIGNICRNDRVWCYLDLLLT